ncbi:MAG: hypothetical protein F6K39_00430 [Okeania sp. SIO3B3]|nr:hypothetical protein [Okeania sp. SIO3B3]
MLVIDKINEIAREMYRLAGYHVRPGYDFFEATHPQERIALEQALAAWQMIFNDTPDFGAEWSE